MLHLLNKNRMLQEEKEFLIINMIEENNMSWKMKRNLPESKMSKNKKWKKKIKNRGLV